MCAVRGYSASRCNAGKNTTSVVEAGLCIYFKPLMETSAIQHVFEGIIAYQGAVLSKFTRITL